MEAQTSIAKHYGDGTDLDAALRRNEVSLVENRGRLLPTLTST